MHVCCQTVHILLGEFKVENLSVLNDTGVGDGLGKGDETLWKINISAMRTT